MSAKGGFGWRGMYLDTAASETSKPSILSSPWIRGAPHNGFSRDIRRISPRNSLDTGGSSRLPPSRLPGPETSEALSMPADNRLRLDDHQDIPPTRPQPRQDDPEKAIGHPKRWPGSFPI